MPSAAAAASTGVAASLRLSIWAAAFFNFSVALTSDLFLHGFAIEVLGVSDVQLALLVSLPAACGFVQLISPYLIEWLGSRKGAVLSSIGAGALVWLLIPLAALGRDRLGLVFVLVVAALCLVQIARSFTGVAALSWISDLIPPGERGAYFGTRQRFVLLITLVITLSAGWLVDLSGGGFGAYWAIFLAAVGFAAIGAELYRRMVEPPIRHAGAKHGLATLLEPFRDAPFRRFLLFLAVWQFGMSFAGAFWNLFMLEELHLGLGFMALLGMVQNLSAIATSRYWGRVVDRVGAKPVMLLAYFAKALFAAAWLFATPASLLYLVAVRLFGASDSAIQVSTSTLLLKLSPPGDNAGHIGAQAGIIALVGALAPLLGGLAAPWLHGFDLALPWAHMHYLHVLIFASFVLRLASLLFLRRVREPEERSLRAALPTMWQEALGIPRGRFGRRRNRRPQERQVGSDGA